MNTATVVLSEVEQISGSNAKGPWTKFNFKDGNGQIVGATFSDAIGAAGDALAGQRVEVDTEPARDPKYAPTIKAVRPAPPEKTATQGGGSEGMSKEEWRAKDEAADLRACIAIASGALAQTLTSGDTDRSTIQNFGSHVLALAHLFFAEVQKQRGPADPTPSPTPTNDDDIPF